MWSPGKIRGLISFGLITVLILGGLTWVTFTALHSERDRQLTQRESQRREAEFQFSKERADLLRQALWRLDARIAPAIAREESRPYPHYIALHSPFPALTSTGVACVPGSVYLPSPLLTAELPEWMSLHFQVDAGTGWISPQVVPTELQQLLRKQPIELALNNVTEERSRLLESLKKNYPVHNILPRFRDLGVTASESPQDAKRWNEIQEIIQSSKQNRPNGRASNSTNNNDINNNLNFQNAASPTGNNSGVNTVNTNPITQQQLDYANRMFVIDRARREGQWAYIFDDNRANFGLTQTFQGKTGITLQTVEVQLGRLRPVWLPSVENPEHLLLVRGATVSGRAVYQGILIDWDALKTLFQEEIADLFPEANFKAIASGEPDNPDRSMTGLPIEFSPSSEDEFVEPEQSAIDESSLLRWGLLIAWGAAILALLATGIGGWSLIDLSERRIRFVSAVTHELRTPLTTLRLYLDLLSSGMVTDEKQKSEYLQTLNAESDRLHRLIVNVLDFARLERTRPQVNQQPFAIQELLNQLQRSWSERCQAAGKELMIDNSLPNDAVMISDSQLLEQTLSNLIDNAQKYSREATDPRIVLRVRVSEKSYVFEVEDRGPGVNKRQRRSVFRPFRRGENADFQAGGVGLGLALATRWTKLIGGTLSLSSGADGIGACFRVSVPKV